MVRMTTSAPSTACWILPTGATCKPWGVAGSRISRAAAPIAPERRSPSAEPHPVPGTLRSQETFDVPVLKDAQGSSWDGEWSRATSVAVRPRRDQRYL